MAIVETSVPEIGVAEAREADAAWPRYREILLAVDSSDHANRGVRDGVALASAWGARVTAAHVYAAQMHDLRFRQMEGGLPERYREEQELERQRDVHDALITRGLSVITDSYLDQAERVCSAAGIALRRRSLEGKNYRRLVEEAESGRYDLLVLGALGLGAVTSSRLGTVCERVVRRCPIDTLVIKQPQRTLAEGPIVAAVDGSARAYGGLLTAIALAKLWQVPLHVVSAFDPYYHYVAFNRIAGVLSEEAGRVFRFQEQERLHEEIIDSGLAKIYDGHLRIAADIAREHSVAAQTRLLDGKPHEVIARHLRELNPSLLVIGRLGIHADDALDIGGNAEALLREAPCAVLLSQREHTPRIERVAEVSIAWTREAEARLRRAPAFVQNMARVAVLRYAQERGHTVVTERLVEEATATLMPARAEQMMRALVAAADAGAPAMAWSEAARRQLQTTADPALRENLRWRAEKKARTDGAREVAPEHLDAVGQRAGEADDAAPVQHANGHGTQSAPGTRNAHDAQNAHDAHNAHNAHDAREAQGPVAREPGSAVDAQRRDPAMLHWQADALARLMRVPEGFMRDTFRSRVEEAARRDRAEAVTLERVEGELTAARAAMESRTAGSTDAAGATARRCPYSGRAAPSVAGDAPVAAIAPVAAVAPAAPDASDAQNVCDAPVAPAAQDAPAAPAAPAAPRWSDEAKARLQAVPAGHCRVMTERAVETLARQHQLAQIDAGFVHTVMQTFADGSRAVAPTLAWDDAARQRIERAPDGVRGMLVREIEGWARRQGLARVDEDAVAAVKSLWQAQRAFHLDPADPRHGV